MSNHLPATVSWGTKQPPKSQSGTSATDFVTKLSLNLWIVCKKQVGTNGTTMDCTPLKINGWNQTSRELCSSRQSSGVYWNKTMMEWDFSNKTARQWWFGNVWCNHDSTSGVINLSSFKQNLNCNYQTWWFLHLRHTQTHHGIHKDLYKTGSKHFGRPTKWSRVRFATNHTWTNENW